MIVQRLIDVDIKTYLVVQNDAEKRLFCGEIAFTIDRSGTG